LEILQIDQALSSQRMNSALISALILQEIAPFLRVLGTYPMDTELGFTSSDDTSNTSKPSL
jgi:hypothetical protein